MRQPTLESRIEWEFFRQRLYLVVGLIEWHYMMSTLLLYNIHRLTQSRSVLKWSMI